MSYTYPPLTRYISFGTAEANVTVTVVLIAAPGPTAALRIVGGHLIALATNTGALNVSRLRDGGTVIDVGTLSAQSAGGRDDLRIPEPGIQLPANANLTMEASSSVAGQVGFIIIYYFIDTLS